MLSGMLRHRITLQRYYKTNTLGKVTETWVDYKTMWALVEPINAKEYFQSVKDKLDVTHRITIRYTAVKPQMRVKFGNRYFEIKSILNEMEKNKKLELLCIEKDIK